VYNKKRTPQLCPEEKNLGDHYNGKVRKKSNCNYGRKEVIFKGIVGEAGKKSTGEKIIRGCFFIRLKGGNSGEKGLIGNLFSGRKSSCAKRKGA